MERGRFTDILDLFKGTIDSQLVGNVKKAYQYRNWVAHGKKGAKKESMDPLTVYDMLRAFLENMWLI